MKETTHELARKLVVLGEDGVPMAEQRWLYAHLAECHECQCFATAFGQVASELRRRTQAVDFALVERTRRSVRRQAQDWRRRHARIRLLQWSSLSMLFLVAVTLRFSWIVLAYVGFRLGYPPAAIQGSFTFFWLIPSIAAGIAIVIGSGRMAGEYPVPAEARQ